VPWAWLAGFPRQLQLSRARKPANRRAESDQFGDPAIGARSRAAIWPLPARGRSTSIRSTPTRIWCLAAAIALIPLGRADAAAAATSVYSWYTVPWGGGGYVDGLVYHPKVKDLLYARTDVGGVYRYDYAGRRWIPLLDALSHDDRDMNGILSVALDPNDPNKLYVACGL
jgi:hypothetical protein